MMNTVALRATPVVCNGIKEKKIADKARARRLRSDFVQIADKEKAYVKSQLRWFKRRHNELQKSVRDTFKDVKENLFNNDQECDEEEYDCFDDVLDKKEE